MPSNGARTSVLSSVACARSRAAVALCLCDREAGGGDLQPLPGGLGDALRAGDRGRRRGQSRARRGEIGLCAQQIARRADLRREQALHALEFAFAPLHVGRGFAALGLGGDGGGFALRQFGLAGALCSEAALHAGGRGAEVGFGALQRGAVFVGVEPRDDVTLLHHGAFAYRQFDDATGHVGRQRGTARGDDVAVRRGASHGGSGGRRDFADQDGADLGQAHAVGDIGERPPEQPDRTGDQAEQGKAERPGVAAAAGRGCLLAAFDLRVCRSKRRRGLVRGRGTIPQAA